MSKDIWHTADEYNYSTIAFPEDAIVVDTGGGKYWAYSSFYDMPHHCDDPDCCFAETSCWKRWAKLDDLLALETDLERTRKALETLQEFITKLYLNGNITDEQLERYKKMLITALEQKD